MKILIAPDKFKGSLTALQVGNAIREGITRINPTADIICVPLADGGEGTCDLLTELSGGSKVKVVVCDPLMRSIESDYGMTVNGDVAFIEMARASGLQLLKPSERNPLCTTTFGTGQLIADALDKGAKKIILAIGGSATTDGGMGMAEALGYSFHSADGRRLTPIGQNLIQVDTIRKSDRSKKIDEATFHVIFDVRNPLYGKQGAAFTFGPQKGACPEEVIELDKGLEHFANVVLEKHDSDINFPGAGAAGGLGGGAKLFLNAKFSPGIDFILEFANLEKEIQHSDLVITGEGKIDEQTFLGKVIQGVAGLAAKHKKKCIAFTGKLDLTPTRVHELGVHQIIALSDNLVSENEAMQNAYSILSRKATEMLRPYLSPSDDLRSS